MKLGCDEMEPLASKMRPKTLKDVLGQDHLIGTNGVLSKMLEKRKWLSFILYGPPGTGKTLVARALGIYCIIKSHCKLILVPSMGEKLHSL